MKKISILLLAALLALGLLPCGCDREGEEAPDTRQEENGDAPGSHEPQEEEGDEETEESGKEALLELGNWKMPATFPELVAMFGQLKVSYTIEDEETIFYYRFLGSETVGDQTTEKVAVNVNEQEMILWLARDGSLAQLALMEEIVPAADAAATGAAVMDKMVKPFARAAGCRIDRYLLEPGENARLISSSEEEFGALKGTLYAVEIKTGTPDKITYECRLADLGTLQTVIGMVETKEDGTQVFRFEIENLAFR
ncbi:MAG TPA: hypothetical protein PKO38_08665 [Bacillota bacterium]|nr:hypothetical protein [Bacillota bacterium]HOB87746.1 hypothetical protein [Bacillota bacterium]HOP69966.1 hypothetical protein [Bacillota bacterium]HPT33151.1 hypothetical protein [Bacillota bacterium]HQD05590.1 hypothetical protein [Bacillota bacterium]